MLVGREGRIAWVVLHDSVKRLSVADRHITSKTLPWFLLPNTELIYGRKRRHRLRKRKRVRLAAVNGSDGHHTTPVRPIDRDIAWGILKDTVCLGLCVKRVVFDVDHTTRAIWGCWSWEVGIVTVACWCSGRRGVAVGKNGKEENPQVEHGG